MIQISVQNTDTADIFVLLVDKNTNPPTTVMNNQRLNDGTAAVVVQIQEDGSGNGNIAWTATRADDPPISHSDNAVPGNVAIVDVYAQ